MTGGDIINAILKELNISAAEFSGEIGLDRPQAIYDLQKGKTRRMSDKMANRILSAYPKFSRQFVYIGEGNIYSDECNHLSETDMSYKKEVANIGIKYDVELLLKIIDRQEREIERLTRENSRINIRLDKDNLEGK